MLGIRWAKALHYQLQRCLMAGVGSDVDDHRINQVKQSEKAACRSCLSAYLQLLQACLSRHSILRHGRQGAIGLGGNPWVDNLMHQRMMLANANWMSAQGASVRSSCRQCLMASSRACRHTAAHALPLEPSGR